MYVLIDEWIPGCPTRLLGATVEDLPVNGERMVKVHVGKLRQGVTFESANNEVIDIIRHVLGNEPEPRNKDPA